MFIVQIFKKGNILKTMGQLCKQMWKHKMLYQRFVTNG